MTVSDKARFIAQNGVYVTTPQGGSMKPFIRGGRDTVVMRAFDGDARPYDVILYAAGESHVMHRVLSVKNGVCKVRGDNCFYTEYVPVDRIMAKAEKVIRDGKKEIALTRRQKLLARCWRCAYPLRYCIHQTGRVFKALGRKLSG